MQIITNLREGEAFSTAAAAVRRPRPPFPYFSRTMRTRGGRSSVTARRSIQLLSDGQGHRV